MVKKSVLIACHAWHQEQFGGAYKLAFEFSEYLANSGHEVHFLCGTDERDFQNPTLFGGLKIWRYPFPKAQSPHPANLWGHINRSRILTRRILQRHKITHLNGHSPLQFLGAGLALHGRGCRRVYSVHSPFVEELRAKGKRFYHEGHEDHEDIEPRRLKERLALRVAGWIEDSIYRNADCIQCDSNFSLSVIRRQYPGSVNGKGVVCPGWVDLGRFGPAEERNTVRGELGAPWEQGIPTFLSVRRLESRMGLESLIEAAAMLRGAGYRFKVIIGGTGPLESYLQAQITDNQLKASVHLVGRISEKQLPAYYAAADCFVLPTRALECFGLIVLEAHACGTPVIATPVGSIPEVIGTDKDWLCEKSSAQAIAQKMKAFLDQKLTSDPHSLRIHAKEYKASNIQKHLAEILFDL